MTKKSIKILSFLTVTVAVLIFYKPAVVSAVCPPDCTAPTPKTTTESSETPDVVRLDNPLGSEVNDVPTLIGKVINGVLSVVGSLALVMFIYGGFTWMLAAGNTEKVKKGRDILIWAALGLVIIFTSYAMVTYVITTISKT